MTNQQKFAATYSTFYVCSLSLSIFGSQEHNDNGSAHQLSDESRDGRTAPFLLVAATASAVLTYWVTKELLIPQMAKIKQQKILSYTEYFEKLFNETNWPLPAVTTTGTGVCLGFGGRYASRLAPFTEFNEGDALHMRALSIALLAISFAGTVYCANELIKEKALALGVLAQGLVSEGDAEAAMQAVAANTEAAVETTNPLQQNERGAASASALIAPGGPSLAGAVQEARYVPPPTAHPLPGMGGASPAT
jgi:hypothetical protein